MGTTLLGSLSAFLHTLGTAPHPDAVARAMVDAFAEPYGAQSATILTLRERRLVVIGLHGYPADEVTAMRAMPVDGDYPLALALREGEVIIDGTRDLATRYAGGRRAGGSWTATVARLPDGTAINAPITSGGLPVGGFSLLCDRVRDWDAMDVAVLDAVGHALGMWLTHPASGLPPAEQAAPPSLSARQVAILGLVAQDRSNTEIAAVLGFSESTVKQELQRILRSLEVGGRREAASRASALGLLGDGSPT